MFVHAAAFVRMMAPNFTACGEAFMACHNTTCSEFVYHGPLRGVFASGNRPPLITDAGCKALCGTGNEYYAWTESRATITTWILPVLGLMVQLPYESNALRDTMWSLARWGGR